MPEAKLTEDDLKAQVLNPAIKLYNLCVLPR